MSSETDPKAAMLRADIDKTRADMARTVDEIEHRLSPAHLKEQVASLKDVVAEQVADLKNTVVDQFHEAKETIKQDLKGDIADARVKVRDEIDDVKTAAYDATVGRMHHMVDDARETVTDAGSSLLGTIKANPIPAALIALGVGWMIMGARSNARLRTSRYAYASPYGGEELDMYAGYVGEEDRPRYDRETGARPQGDVAGRIQREGRSVLARGQRSVAQAGHRVAEGVEAARSKVSDGASYVAENARSAAENARNVAHRVGDKAGHLVDEARSTAVHVASDARNTGRNVVRGAGRQYHRVEQTVEVAYGDNPLAFGAVALAVGAAVGLALPHTSREDQWMGPMKTRLLDQAQHAATDAIHRAEESVGQLGHQEPQQATPRNYDRV